MSRGRKRVGLSWIRYQREQEQKLEKTRVANEKTENDKNDQVKEVYQQMKESEIQNEPIEKLSNHEAFVNSVLDGEDIEAETELQTDAMIQEQDYER